MGRLCLIIAKTDSRSTTCVFLHERQKPTSFDLRLWGMTKMYRRRHLPLEPRALSTDIPAVFSQPLLINAQHHSKAARIVEDKLASAAALFQVDPFYSTVENVQKVTESASSISLPGVSELISADVPSETSDATSRRLEPKVFIQYATTPGTVPRRVEIERRRRNYATQDIRHLLTKEGIHAKLSTTTRTPQTITDIEFLPLYWFDNVDYDERTTDEWVEAIESAVAKGVPAKGKAQVNSGRWVDVKITGHHPTSQRWRVTWHQEYHHVATGDVDQNAIRGDHDEWECWVHR